MDSLEGEKDGFVKVEFTTSKRGLHCKYTVDFSFPPRFSPKFRVNEVI